MARKPNTERNLAIYQALQEGKLTRTAVAEQFGVSYPHTYRVEKLFSGNGDSFQALPQAGGSLFTELAQTGLRRYGGRIDDEYDRRFKSLNKRVHLYREMGDDPVVASILQAVKMLIRRLGWSAEKQGETSTDEEAAEFLDTAKDDMSQSWSDTIDQSLGMIQYGFAVAEEVYKRRRGPKVEHASKYDDERIGWRKWTFIAPETLSPGDEWVYDEHGGLQGLNQQPPTGSGISVRIPIDKAILFRPTVEKGNPEGRSLLRPMYPPWYYKKNLEEVEAISAERMGAGLPVVYVGSDVSKGPGSEFEKLKEIGRNVRVDEQMVVAIPFPKMGQGAGEGKGVLFELVSPPSRGIIHFHETITRYEQRMAMVGLAQFIHLGMNQVGARALGDSFTDFFTLAIEAWADMLQDTIQRFAVERLFRVNHFPGLTAIPLLKHDAVRRISLTEIATFVNQLSQAALLTPSLELENTLRVMAELPERVAHPIEIAKPNVSRKTEMPMAENEPAQTVAEMDSERFYDPNQPRDEQGRFGEGGNGGGKLPGAAKPAFEGGHLEAESGNAIVMVDGKKQKVGELSEDDLIRERFASKPNSQRMKVLTAEGNRRLEIEYQSPKYKALKESSRAPASGAGTIAGINRPGIILGKTSNQSEVNLETDPAPPAAGSEPFFNVHHDESGRFAPANGGGGGGGREKGGGGYRKITAANQAKFSKRESEDLASLKQPEKRALQKYTQDEGAGSYAAINGRLRSGNVSGTEIEALDSAIAKGSLDEPTLVYRGFSGDSLPSDNLAGATVSDRAYLSTSVEASVARDFAGPNGTVAEMRLPKGSQGLWLGGKAALSGFGSEGEFLMGRNSRFRVASDSQVEGQRRLVLEAIP